MRIYLDSSVMLRYLLNGDESIIAIGPEHEVASSELLEIECRRVIQRERLEKRIDDAQCAAAIGNLERVLEMLSTIEIERNVKRMACGSFPTVIGTLDAIHLSSALLWREAVGSEVSILTYDKQLRISAEAMGLRSFQL